MDHLRPSSGIKTFCWDVKIGRPYNTENGRARIWWEILWHNYYKEWWNRRRGDGTNHTSQNVNAHHKVRRKNKQTTNAENIMSRRKGELKARI